MNLIPNQPMDPLPDELYDELEFQDLSDEADWLDQIEDYMLSFTNLTVDEIEQSVETTIETNT